MKSILKQKTAYPIGFYNVPLEYRTKRAITAFEELILEAASERVPCTLEELAEVLGVDKIFLKEAFKHLSSCGNFVNDGVRHLGALRLSEVGQKHFEEKKMVGREKNENVSLFVDYANNNKMYLEKQRAWKEWSANCLVVLENCCGFNVDFQDLEKLISQDPKRFSWYDPVNTEIASDYVNIEPMDPQYCCPLTLELQVDGNNHLSIHTDSKDFQAWMERLGKERVHEELVRPLLPNNNAPLLDLTWQDALEMSPTPLKISPSTTLWALVWGTSEELQNLKIPTIDCQTSIESPALQGQCLKLPASCLQESGSSVCVYADSNQQTQEILYGNMPYYYNNQRYETTCFIKTQTTWDWQSFWHGLLETYDLHVYVFVARFVKKEEWIKTLFKTKPQMSLQECLELSQKVKETWKQDMHSKAWLEHLPLLDNLQDLGMAKDLVGSKISFAKLAPHLQMEVLDQAFQETSHVLDNIQDLQKLEQNIKEYHNIKNLFDSKKLPALNILQRAEQGIRENIHEVFDWQAFWQNLLSGYDFSTYVFVARFVDKQTWMDALFKARSKMSWQECLELSQKIKKIWEKDMHSKAWLEHLPLLDNLQDLGMAKDLVGSKISFAELSVGLQQELVELAMQQKTHAFADIQDLQKLEHGIQSYHALQRLLDPKNPVSLDTFEKLKQGIQEFERLVKNYPHLNLQNPLQQLQDYKDSIDQNFEKPTQEKYALLDLNLLQTTELDQIKERAQKRTLLYSKAQARVSKGIKQDISSLVGVAPKPALLQRMFGNNNYSKAEEVLACAYYYCLNDIVIYSHDPDLTSSAHPFGLSVQAMKDPPDKKKKKKGKK